MAEPEKTAQISLSAPSGTQAGTFNVIASFAESVSGFGNMNISIAPDDDNPGDGTTGITWTVTGSGRHYNVLFEIPEEAKGKFKITVSGQVDISGEMVDISGGLSLLISYDSATELTAEFGEIDLPVILNEDVLYFHKTDADLQRIIGDSPYEFDVFLTEVDARNYKFTFVPLPNKAGLFSIHLPGYVFRTATSIRDNIIITPKLVPFNSYQPYMVNANIPDALSAGIWDIFVELSTPAIAVSVNDFQIEFARALPTGFSETIQLYYARSLDSVPKPSGAAGMHRGLDTQRGKHDRTGEVFYLTFRYTRKS